MPAYQTPDPQAFSRGFNQMVQLGQQRREFDASENQRGIDNENRNRLAQIQDEQLGMQKERAGMEQQDSKMKGQEWLGTYAARAKQSGNIQTARGIMREALQIAAPQKLAEFDAQPDEVLAQQIEQFAAFAPPLGANNSPAAVQVHQFAEGLPPDERERFDRRLRAPRTFEAGGVTYELGPDGRVAPLTSRESQLQFLEESERAKGRGDPTRANPTEGERKGAVLGTRLEGALRTLEGLQQSAPGAEKPGWMEKAAGAFGETAANYARSPERQQADIAQTDALDAALTLATGAAYTKEQLSGLRKAYFPQLGDSPETIEAKQRMFETVVQTARIAAGRAEPSIDQALDPQGGARVQPGQPAPSANVGGVINWADLK